MQLTLSVPATDGRLPSDRLCVHSLSRRTPRAFYLEFEAFTRSSLDEMRRVLPPSPVLGSCCDEQLRASRGVWARPPGTDPLSGRRWDPPLHVTAHLGRRGPNWISLHLTV